MTFCPGFLRGLAFVGRYAIVGLSGSRAGAFGGLVMHERLAEKGALARCAVQVINLDTGDIEHEIRFQGEVSELFDIAVIEDVRCAGTVGMNGEEFSTRITLPPESRAL